MTLRIPLSDQSYATIISAYAPTMTNNDENKERFYEQLDDAVRKVNVRDKLVMLGDFNARIGSNYTAWPNVVGKHGIGHENSNGKLLPSFCSSHTHTVDHKHFIFPDERCL